jgi:hypothetical protein
MQMFCCYERDGPIRECFTASMADALPPWFQRMLGRHGRRFCGYTTLLPTIVLSLLILGSVGWGCLVEGPPLSLSCFLAVRLCLWDLLVILELLANPMYFSS